MRGSGEFHLAVCGSKRGTRILLDDNLRGVSFRSTSHLYVIRAGHDSGALGGFKSSSGGRRHMGRLQAHRPIHPADATPAVWGKRIYELALRIENFDFHFSEDMALLLIVGNHCSVGRIWPIKCRTAFHPPAV